MPRGSASPIPYRCNVPYHCVTIDYNSNCFICQCDAWIPIPVGQVQDFDTLDDLFDSPTAKILQKDVDDQKFTWCATSHCGIKHRNIIKHQFELAINIDESCNLRCPSCRRDSIMHLDGEIVQQKQKDINRIMSWLENFDRPIHVILSGNGDPLASRIIRPLIKQYQPKETQTFRLFTNGLLLKKHLSDSPLLPNVTEFFISVDAGTAEVYKNVRLGGTWEVLMENLQYLQSLGLEKLVRLNFAVQNSNWVDVPTFINLCLDMGFSAHLHQLDDWGTWSNKPLANPDAWTIVNGTFRDHDVLNHQHKNYNQCRELIQEQVAKHRGNRSIHFSNRLLQLLNL